MHTHRTPEQLAIKRAAQNRALDRKLVIPNARTRRYLTWVRTGVTIGAPRGLLRR